MTIITLTAIREDWLIRAVAHLEPIFQNSGYQIPKVKVSIGFPSTGAKRQGLTIAHRLKNATKADLAKKTGKSKEGIKANPLLQSILGKVNKDGKKDK